MPHLVNSLHSENAKVRVCAAWAIRQLSQLAADAGEDTAEIAIPALSAALEDDEFEVRKDAAAALQFFGAKAREAIPSLIENLQYPGLVRAYSASALGRIGPNARASIPTLLRILPEDQDGLDTLIKDAITQIDPESLVNSTKQR